MQVVLEAVCDFVCLYIEITKLKAPIVNAWKGRTLALFLSTPGVYAGAGVHRDFWCKDTTFIYEIHAETHSFLGIGLVCYA